MSTAVLLAETEPGTRSFLERHLVDDGFDVVAPERVQDGRPDLVLLGDARHVGEWAGEVPVIVLGGEEADVVDRVRAFARGCDDYVAEPFLYDELVARIRAVLRRAKPVVDPRFEAGAIRVDPATRRVTVAGERVELAGKEYQLLLKLMSEPERVFTKDELLRDVWGFRSRGRTRTLDSHASRLRRKLGATGYGPFVVNSWGVGYRLLDD
jgi:DNA-binding response OmpR family regulator